MDIDPRHVDEILATPELCGAGSISNDLSTTSCCLTASTSPNRRLPAATSAAAAGSSCVTSCQGPARRALPADGLAVRVPRRGATAWHRPPPGAGPGSSEYLAEHLAEVPAIVIPTIIGRHDGNGRPGLFDSVIQAAWSFCLALGRGLGTTGSPRPSQDEARIKEILGIPDDMTEIVLLPVAWTKGTDSATPRGTPRARHLLRPLRHHVRARSR